MILRILLYDSTIGGGHDVVTDVKLQVPVPVQGSSRCTGTWYSPLNVL
jgi:hypothetical protein